jgi:chemotaxis response regulator CheB
MNGHFHYVRLCQLEGDAMMRILVIKSGSLLEEGIVPLLSPRIELDVWNARFESTDELISYIESVRPTVVVINRSFSKNLDKLSNCLRRNVGLKLLIVSDDSNMITVYENSETQEFTIHEIQDFTN